MEEALKIARQIADGLLAAHKKGIVQLEADERIIGIVDVDLERVRRVIADVLGDILGGETHRSPAKQASRSGHREREVGRVIQLRFHLNLPSV